MIASQKIGKSFMGALSYNLKKMNGPDVNRRAELLDTNFISMDPRHIKMEVDLVRELRPNLGRNVYHTSLNFLKEEEQVLTNEKLLAIAHDYLFENGFTNNQYLIFRHYDAEHPHVHLLVNRICFDGSVVSDSNNYKKSEAILRKLEERYNLIAVEQSNNIAGRAPKKDELEMVMRTGQPSDKMLMQELMKKLLKNRPENVSEMIRQGERMGIRFLFNQASTGRITGITYFYKEFKIKGQALGNAFKWSDVIKKVSYEQDRDGKAIGEANGRTTANYRKLGATSGEIPNEQGRTGSGLVREDIAGGAFEYQQTERATGNGVTKNESAGSEHRGFAERSLEANQDPALLDNGTVADFNYGYAAGVSIELTDDIDDEAIHGRNRHRKRQARMNRR